MIINSKLRITISTKTILKYYCSFFHFGLSKRSKKTEKVQTQVNHSAKPGRKKALNIALNIPITPPIYSFMPQNYFKLPFTIQLMSNI